MPRNVSQSPHELPTYTLRFIFTLRASAQRAGRILADRYRLSQSKSSKARLLARLFVFGSCYFWLVLFWDRAILGSCPCRGTGHPCPSKRKGKTLIIAKGPLRNQRPFLFSL